MTDQQEQHVFISYVRENKDQVDRLCHDLEQHGVKVWLDRHSIKPGARWKDAIRKAIRNGNFFIACFSDEYTAKTKTYMNEELTLATEELRQYASDREWFIPVLLSECDVPARSIGAGETLLDINWVPLYEDWDAGIQRILSVIKPIPKEIQNLISALRSKDKDVRDRTVKALLKIGGSSAVPPLTEALKDEDREVRWKAAQALRRIGPEAKDAVPALIEALKDEYGSVRRQAAEALGNIGPDAKAAVSALIEVFKEGDSYVRMSVAQALGNIGPEAKSSIPALSEEALKDEYALVRNYVTQALGKLGPKAVPALIEALKDRDEYVRGRATEALSRIGPKAVPALIEALKEEHSSVRRGAAVALRRIGPEAKAAVPALIEVLKDESKYVHTVAAGALKEINTPEARKALEEYKKKSS